MRDLRQPAVRVFNPPDLGLRIGATLWLLWDVRGHVQEGREPLRELRMWHPETDDRALGVSDQRNRRYDPYIRRAVPLFPVDDHFVLPVARLDSNKSQKRAFLEQARRECTGAEMLAQERKWGRSGPVGQQLPDLGWSKTPVTLQ